MTPDELRALLTATGLAQMRVAHRLGVSQPTVAHWLSGRNPIVAALDA